MGRIGSESYIGSAMGIYAIEPALKRAQNMEKRKLLKGYSRISRFALIDMSARIIQEVTYDTREEYRVFLSCIGSSSPEDQSSFFHGIRTHEVSVYREIGDSFVDGTHDYPILKRECLSDTVNMILWMTFLKSLYLLYRLLVIIDRIIGAIEQYIDLKNIWIQGCPILILLPEGTFPESMIDTLPFFVGGEIDREHAIPVHGRDLVCECSQFAHIKSSAYLFDIHPLFGDGFFLGSAQCIGIFDIICSGVQEENGFYPPVGRGQDIDTTGCVDMPLERICMITDGSNGDVVLHSHSSLVVKDRKMQDTVYYCISSVFMDNIWMSIIGRSLRSTRMLAMVSTISIPS